MLKRVGWVVAALVVLYLVLLIPFGERVKASPGGERPQKQPFAWNQDKYWEALEATYRALREGACTTAAPALALKFQTVKRIRHKVD